ncbi:MAG: cytochrome c [Candidatus Rokubacteria bacterium]|nr:cytochrome c [Candidatus Rokubacteria bacterium]
MRPGALAGFTLALILAACAEDSTAPGPGSGDPNRGRQVYLTQCTACHNPDPSKPGSLAPPVKGSSPVLLEARLVRGMYPPGYKPKRESSVMQPMLHLAPAIPDLAAFLQ